MCLFCKIVTGEIPSYKVFENENVLAFLDINPCAKGHTVVIPKKHADNLEAVNMEEWLKIASAVKQIAELINKILRPDGLNIGLNNNPAAGQAVGHLHWHIIPRYINDGGGSMHSIVKNGNKDEVATVAKMFG